MAKILSLRLNYKGQFLDYAKEGKEIRKQFFIGSNKNLQWQILDPAFPDKHLFVKQVGNSLVMNIPAGAAFSCERDGKQVDSSYLQQNNLLSGNQLVLDQNLKGNVNVHKEWDVDFEYREPWVAVLTHEQRQIVAECATRATADPVSKFNRAILLIATILTVLFLVIFDLFLKKDQVFDASVEDRLLTMNAQKVTPQITDAPAILPKWKSKNLKVARLPLSLLLALVKLVPEELALPVFPACWVTSIPVQPVPQPNMPLSPLSKALP